MVLLRPSAFLSVDGRDLSIPEAAAVAVAVESTVTGGHDRAWLVLGPLSPWLAVDVGAAVALSLGPSEDDVTAVFTGEVERVRHGSWGTALTMLGSTAALNRIRIGRAYTAQTAGDIVRDLCAEAGVTPGDIDDGPTLAAYHVDERRTGWRHLRDLARLLSAELATGAAGEVHVRAPRTGSAQHTLRAGAELLDWSAGRRQVGADPLEVGPYGAASEQGSDAWSLLHHQPGGGGAHRILPAIRDRESAAALDRAAGAAHARSGVQARVLTTGQPAVRAGDLVELDGVPRAAATYRVLRARHGLDARGLHSALELEAS